MRFPTRSWRVLLLVLSAVVHLHAQGIHVTLRSNADPFPAFESYAGVWGDGHYAYLASERRNGVLIYDVANPDNPALVGTYAPANSLDMEDVKVANGVGYFADNMGSGLHIVDVSDPTNPTLLSQITSANGGYDNTHKVGVWGNFVYLPQNLTSPAIIKVFDVSDPANPVLHTTFTATDAKWINDVDIQMNPAGRVILYAAGWGSKCDIWDITDIATQAPTLLGSFNAGAQGSSASATSDGNFLAYSRKTTNGTSEVKIYDISNPAAATVVSTLTMSALGIDAVAPHDPKISGNLLYVSWYQAGTLTFDITNPASPVLVGSYDTWPGPPTPGQLEGNWGVYPYLGQDRVLLSDRNTGLYIINATGVSSQPALYNLHLNPTSVLGGSPSTGTAYLVGLAGAGGFVVTTSSDNPVAVVPPSVTVPSGGQSANFTVTTSTVTTVNTANITATDGTNTNTAELTVSPGPDYTLVAGPSQQTLFPGQTGTIDGTLSSVGGYSSLVTLSCVPPGAPPPTCSFSPSTLMPTPSGVAFTLTVASNTTGDYSFILQAVGNDSKNVTHQLPITVNVADFTLGAPSPSSLSVTPGANAPFSSTVASAGMFNGVVDVSCNAPATGITCSFVPSSAVTPAPGVPVPVTVTVNTTPATPVGLYNLVLSATSVGAPAPKTQTVSVRVMDFGISSSSGSQTVSAGQPAMYSLTVNPDTGGFTSAISFNCSNLPLRTSCSFSPSSVTPGGSPTPVMLTVQTTAPVTAHNQSSRAASLAYALCLPLGLSFLCSGSAATKRVRSALMLITAIVLLGLMLACGGNGSSSGGGQTHPGTPPGNYTITVNAVSGALTHSTPVSLTVQ